MDFYIIIPAHNEQDTIGLTLDSLANQTLLPKQVVVVNDNSTDDTASIVLNFSIRYDWISLINNTSSEAHLPGSKIINAFYKGYKILDRDYDVICKYDADLIFPLNYLEALANIFNSNNKIGIAGGIPYIKKNGKWIYETVASKNHVRGPIKSYRKNCFKEIGGLKKSVGWDSIDILLARYYGWEIETDKNLHVKHLKPTGKNYSKNTKHIRGIALYKMRFGVFLTLISLIKSAYNKKEFSYFINSINGYLKAKSKKAEYLITAEQGKFIRKYRWKQILKKMF